MPLNKGISITGPALMFDIENASARFAMKLRSSKSGYDDTPLLSYTFPYQSHARFQINHSYYTYGDTKGKYTETPKNIGSMARSVWVIDGIAIKQEMRLKNNVIILKYVCENTGTTSRKIGMRLMLDTVLYQNDNGRFIVPRTGQLLQETTYNGASVPDFWYSMYNIDTEKPAVWCRINENPYGKPDSVVFACAERIANAYYHYTADPKRNYKFTPLAQNDTGFAAFWNQKELAPQERIIYTISLGQYTPVIRSNPPYAVALFVNDKAYRGEYTIACDIENIDPTTTLRSIQAKLILPPNCQLLSSTPTISIDKLSALASSHIGWKIKCPSISGKEFTIEIFAQYRGGYKKTKITYIVP